MENPNGQEYSTETEMDTVGGEPLTDSGFEEENADSGFIEGAEE